MEMKALKTLIVADGGFICLLSELGSNTATAGLVIPILAARATRWVMDPQCILWPAPLAASLGFVLPVASSIQIMVFNTGLIAFQEMVQADVWKDLFGVLLLMLFLGW